MARHLVRSRWDQHLEHRRGPDPVHGGRHRRDRSFGAFLLASTLLMVVVPPVLLFSLMLRRRTLIKQRPLDRLRTVSLSLGALAWLTGGQRMGSWMETPVIVWALAAGLVAASVTVGVRHFSRVPTENARWRWLHVPVFVLSIAFSLTFGALMLWGLLIAHT